MKVLEGGEIVKAGTEGKKFRERPGIAVAQVEHHFGDVRASIDMSDGPGHHYKPTIEPA
jgi:hypothetical protein